jgi:hypothetical protein
MKHEVGGTTLHYAAAYEIEKLRAALAEKWAEAQGLRERIAESTMLLITAPPRAAGERNK